MVVLVAALPFVYAQESTDSTTNAKPVLPGASDAAKDSGNSVAKATPLPPTDTPASRVAGIRADNYMITLPLIGEIKAVGLTPVQLQDQIVTALQKVISDPQVTVIVTAVNSMSYNIVGQVAKPGYYSLTRPMTVLDGIALCGGFRDFAKQKKIYVLRTGPDGNQERLKFNYKQVIKGKNMAQNIQLQPHDTLVVP
jgi:polysaccharide export outer membrane protein